MKELNTLQQQSLQGGISNFCAYAGGVALVATVTLGQWWTAVAWATACLYSDAC